MPTYTVLVQREPEAAGMGWTNDSDPAVIEAPDAVDAAIAGFRQLRVLPKRHRLLLWQGRSMSLHIKPRIFHNGS